ncbi:MAG: hypothetical protein AAGG75_05110 [Bacteroidota bacterium]
MKVSKLFLLVGMLATFVFTACNKDDQAVELPGLTDSEWLSAFYSSDAAIGAGKVVDGEKFGVTVNNDDLSQSLVAHLDGKSALELKSDIKIDDATVQAIWGDQLPDGNAIEGGFMINTQNVEIRETYMSPEGEDLSQLVAQNPDILNDRSIDIIEYTYVEVDTEVTIEENGDITIEIEVTVEECTIIIF